MILVILILVNKKVICIWQLNIFLSSKQGFLFCTWIISEVSSLTELFLCVDLTFRTNFTQFKVIKLLPFFIPLSIFHQSSFIKTLISGKNWSSYITLTVILSVSIGLGLDRCEVLQYCNTPVIIPFLIVLWSMTGVL